MLRNVLFIAVDVLLGLWCSSFIFLNQSFSGVFLFRFIWVAFLLVLVLVLLLFLVLFLVLLLVLLLVLFLVLLLLPLLLSQRNLLKKEALAGNDNSMWNLL